MEAYFPVEKDDSLTPFFFFLHTQAISTCLNGVPGNSQNIFYFTPTLKIFPSYLLHGSPCLQYSCLSYSLLGSTLFSLPPALSWLVSMLVGLKSQFQSEYFLFMAFPDSSQSTDQRLNSLHQDQLKFNWARHHAIQFNNHSFSPATGHSFLLPMDAF